VIWLVALKAARAALGFVTGALQVADIGRDIVRDVRASLLPPADEESVPLTWETVDHQRRQATSAAHAFPPSSPATPSDASPDTPTQPAVPRQMPPRRARRRTEN
jgi:hypothetical protein